MIFRFEIEPRVRDEETIPRFLRLSWILSGCNCPRSTLDSGDQGRIFYAYDELFSGNNNNNNNNNLWFR